MSEDADLKSFQILSILNEGHSFVFLRLDVLCLDPIQHSKLIEKFGVSKHLSKMNAETQFVKIAPLVVLPLSVFSISTHIDWINQAITQQDSLQVNSELPFRVTVECVDGVAHGRDVLTSIGLHVWGGPEELGVCACVCMRACVCV